ncbi:hypothetical protein M419DRAFT_6568 [Trichoderma reesei RUT C-30]|uniref:Nephrocystin 3-like N-terminal domain-containing protein n=1 Tax=Hypocrea jecorina (strain ATCC 56765 / BCRC 32924 / NRRL 11460 / Rut C-30) TaxID=1344414 RepID=A0A024SGT5_HYPJR|nr:hypothetical protein M419DRAFT_6568 [Trichoderma reesei RUT C-30]
MSGLEILGAFAAAEQLVEVLVKTVRLVKSVVNQVQDAPGQIQQQIGRLESFKSLAKQIQDTQTLQTDDIDKILEEENILKLFNQLDQEYNSLNTHINLHMLAMTETLHTGVQSIESKIRSIAQAADSTPESVKCLQNLFITDPAKDRAKLITSKGELVLGTCDWITQRKEFLDWQASNGGLLWISGGPGLGKTMLSIYLTEYLSSSFRPSDNANGHLSMYFFCDAKDNTRNNAAAILRGLLFQLLEHDMELIKHILPSYQVQQERLFEQNSLEGLWGLFLLMVNSLGDLQVTCVLDGLDECRFLRVRLDPDAKTEVSAGLEQYISTRVAELSESRQYPAELAFHVKQTLRAKSAGTYLWVSFVIKDLQTMELSEVEESLDKFPRGLEALYERILEQIEPTRRDTTLDILRWSTFAVRPLSLTEMAGALGIQPTEHLDRVTVLRGKLAYCGHLINTANDVVTLPR